MKRMFAVVVLALAACGGPVSEWRLHLADGRDATLSLGALTLDGITRPTIADGDATKTIAPFGSDFYTVSFTSPGDEQKGLPVPGGFLCTHKAYPTIIDGVVVGYAYNVSCEIFSAEQQ